MKKYLKIISLGSILLLFFATSFMACEKNDESNPPGNNNNQFEGNIIIVGAGASGLAAAKKLEENGISYQILEATDKFGGRIQKNEDFADFPIDLGAEWIHEDKLILNYLINLQGLNPMLKQFYINPWMFMQKLVEVFGKSQPKIWRNIMQII